MRAGSRIHKPPIEPPTFTTPNDDKKKTGKERCDGHNVRGRGSLTWEVVSAHLDRPCENEIGNPSRDLPATSGQLYP